MSEAGASSVQGPWVLVLDIGSSSVRVWLYDRAARGLDPGPEAHREYAWTSSPVGAMECAAEELFAQVVAALDGAVAHARAAGLEVAAVGVAAFWHSLLGVGADGRPLTPVYGWGDARAVHEALRLRASEDEGAVHRRTGCFFHPSYPSVKLLWLRRSDPEGYGRVAAWVSFPEYVEQRLFGRRRCSLSMASGSGLLDVHRLDWDGEWLERAGLVESQLSPLVDTDATVTGLRGEFARRWPELARIPWFAALGDGACANVGSGAVGRRAIGLTVGTSAAVRALWAAPEVDVQPELWCYRLDGRRWVSGLALSNGGNAVAYLRRTLVLPPERDWEAELAAMEPDAHGLTILPFLVGERGPGWLDQTRSAVVGLTPTTSPARVVRAWMEAIAFRVAAAVDHLDRALGRVEGVEGSGGALHASPIWAQIMADVLDRPVALPLEREATCRGAALVVQERLGWIEDLEQVPSRDATRFEPDPARHARYRAAIERQRSLESRLAPWTREWTPPPLSGADILDS